MCSACYNVPRMPKMIQIRNVPDDIHKKLKIRAAREGLTLSDLLLRDATRLANTPTLDELTERIRRREPWPNITAERIVRLIREDRGPLGPQ